VGIAMLKHSLSFVKITPPNAPSPIVVYDAEKKDAANTHQSA